MESFPGRFPLTPHSAIRKDDYKLIFDRNGRLKLYNIRKDISETNLMKQQPDLTKELFAELIDYLENIIHINQTPLWCPNGPSGVLVNLTL